MMKEGYKCLIVSDFNISNLGGYLNNETAFPEVKASIAPYGQVLQILMQSDAEVWKNNYDFALIWTRPQSLIESFTSVLSYQNVPMKKLLNEVDAFCEHLIKVTQRVKFAFFPTWVVPSYYRGFGMLDMKHETGISNILSRMNLRISENLDKVSNIYVLNTQRWIELSGKNAYNPKLFYMGKIEYGNEVFKEATKDIKVALQGISGNSKKLIILDLDDTLWGGIVGDLGWENLKLGGHDPVGEAFVDFQMELKALTNRGVLLGIVSKNEEQTALEAIEKNSEMILKKDDFAGWKINWNDKAQNVVELVSEINIGLQSTVFIDDNPVERARVRETLSEVFVPEWPQDKMLYKKTLQSLACFDTPSLSKEDFERSKMYAIERERSTLKANVGSIDEWLATLDICVKVEELNDVNLTRTAQLLNKTNQMNLSTRRLSEDELISWASEDYRRLLTFRVSDKFGDSGLTGILSLEKQNQQIYIIDFILSCRVMGRKIEEAMLSIAVQNAVLMGADKIFAKYLPTPKNKPCLEFFNKSKLSCDEKTECLYWYSSKEYPVPNAINIKYIG